jgi:hypothetical protein
VIKTPTDRAVGKILAYDTTLVTPRESSTLLERGHKITKSDVELLKNSGVYQVWTDDNKRDLIYEWEISSEIANTIVDETTEMVEGKHGIAFLVSKIPGLLRVNRSKLIRFNLNQRILLITRGEKVAVGRGEVVAAIDVIPLGIKRKEMEKIKNLASAGMVSVKPFRFSRVGLVITGTEIFEKRKKDQYFKIVKRKCEKYGWNLIYKEISTDDRERETKAILNARDAGAEAIIVTGGMSVDPTDQTPGTISKLGARVIAYGIPMKPTTMTIVSIWQGRPLFGISAGGIRYSDFNSIDVIFTRLMAGEVPTKREIAELGWGGIYWNHNGNKPRSPNASIRNITKR